MEQGDLLSPGSDNRPLSPETVGARLARWQPKGRRHSPLGPGEQLLPRGDHELNPELYDPEQSLVPAAVLIPILEHRELSVLLTRRTDHLHDHAGQIAFPGGRIDEGDADAVAAALREAEEEVGLAPSSVRISGRLDTYVTRTGFEVTPIVGLVRPPFEPELDRFEVAEVFEVPLRFFLEPANRQIHSRVWKGKERRFYVFPYEDYYIWGATAGMLCNLAEALRAS